MNSAALGPLQTTGPWYIVLSPRLIGPVHPGEQKKVEEVAAWCEWEKREKNIGNERIAKKASG